MNHRIPPERLAAFAPLAELSKTTPVLVACTSPAVRRQYIRAVERHGGRLDNLYFYTLGAQEQEPAP